MMQKNKELQSKACTLLKFMYYDWEKDAKFKDYTKDHVPTKGDEKAQKEEMEGIKRNYYSQYVDKDFEKTFEFNSEEDKEEYFTYCQYLGNMGSLSYF